MARLPYPGLRAFRHDETELFFGRDDIVKRMVRQIAETRFLAVLGASGSGKSSVVRTGIIDALEMGRLRRAGSRWRILDFSPAGAPTRNLAAKLLNPDAAEIDVELQRAFLMRGPRSLIEWCERGNLPEKTNLLVLVDQFEELFRYQDYAGRDEAEAFVALLLESARAETLPIYVIITMRSEYLGACTLIEGLVEEINRGQFLIPRMTRSECEEAITGPAGVCGFRLEPALVNRLLNDLESFAPWDGEHSVDQLDRLVRRADQLPIMQHALNRMWSIAVSNPARSQPLELKVADYEAIGGLKGTLNGQAKEILAELGDSRVGVTETVFRALTAGTSIANAVREPKMFSSLVALADGREDDVRAVVEAFAAPGRSLLQIKTSGPLRDESWIDISHEALIRQWTQLSEWLHAEADSAAHWRRLQGAAAMYAAGTGELLSGRLLANDADWWERQKPTPAWAERYDGKFRDVQAFFNASLEAERLRGEQEAAEAVREADLQRLRLRRRYLTVVGILCVVAPLAAFAGYSAVRANQERQHAVEQTMRAEHSQEEAERQAAAAEAERQRADEERRRAVAAEQEALRQQQTAEVSRVQAEAAAAEAQAEREAADEQRQIAEQQRRIADEQRQGAEEQRRLADEQRTQAETATAEARAQKSIAEAALAEVRETSDRFRVGIAGRLLANDPGKALQLVLASLRSEEDPIQPDLPVAERALKQIVQHIEGPGEPSALVRPGLVIGHSLGVSSVALSPDEKRFVSTSSDTTALVWSTESGSILARLRGHGGPVTDAVFTSQGNEIVTSSEDGTIRLWNAGDGEEIRQFPAQSSPLTLALSPDGATLAAGFTDGTIRFWSFATGEVLYDLSGHTDYVRSVAFSPDGSLLLSVSDDRTAYISIVATGEIRHRLTGHSEWIYGGAFSRDGTMVATVAEAIKLWSVENGLELITIQDAEPSNMYLRSVAFSPDREWLAVGDSSNAVSVWSLGTGQRVVGPLAREGSINDVEYSADGKHIFAASEDGTVSEWSASGGELERAFGFTPNITALAYDATGERLVAGTSDGSLQLWSVPDKRMLREVQVPGAPISTALFTADGGDVLFLPSGGVLQIWSVTTGEIRDFGTVTGALCADISPDGTLVAAGMQDGSAILFSMETGAVVRTITGHTDWVRSVAFSPDGKRLLTGSDDYSARIWDVASGEQLQSLEGHENYLYAVDFSPDGRAVATGASDGSVRIWSALTGRPQSRFDGETYETFTQTLFSPDSELLAILSSSGPFTLWSVEFGTMILNPKIEFGSITSAAFSRDGRTLAAGGSDGTIHLYSLIDPDRLRETARSIAAGLSPLTPADECEYLISAAGCDSGG